jgi:beta-xylosidase
MDLRTEAPAGQPSPDGRDADARQAWRDPALPVAERVADLVARMTVPEKLAQLSGIWIGTGAEDGDGVAPMQGDFAETVPLAELIGTGVGQLTRVFGTAPVTPAAGAAALARLQQRVTAASRFGIPVVAHEECLTGFATWGATAFPTPLAWGASFDEVAVREMAAAIGRSMRSVGIHQGLAPVLDVSRDPRWGRSEETIGEDPYLVAVLGTAYVIGLQSAGVLATLKHFAGYSASQGGRNLAPVDIGPRVFADEILPPFEMAIRDGGARSVMASYTSIDGVPSSADPELLTRKLRAEFGFSGTVVSDYYGISFLETLHRVAGSPAEAGATALRAGIDVELPNRRCYGASLAAAVSAGELAEEVVDQAVARVLQQKFELGLLDPGWSPEPESLDPATAVDLNPPDHQRLARLLAEESIVLLANDQRSLPLDPAARIAVIGPLADDPMAFFGCYTFPRHVGYRHPEYGPGVPVQSVLSALRNELPDTAISYSAGCAVQSANRSGIPAAVACAQAADLAVVVVGDEAGLFGRGSSGEGCDASDLWLPGVQQDLLDAVLEVGGPVVLVVISGRPYALRGLASLGAAVQAFFPGQEGAEAIAGVLSGRITPSGKLPVQLPANSGAQPASYLGPLLAGPTKVSAVDPTPLFPFGHGLSYTSFEYSQLSLSAGGEDSAASPAPSTATLPTDATIPTDGAIEIACTVTNSGQRTGAEVVQLYLHDPVAQLARPVKYLAGFARLELAPGQARRVAFTLHADRTAYHGLSGERIVEAGRIDIEVGSSAADIRLTGTLTLHGPTRTVGLDRVMTTPVAITEVTPAR